MKKSGSNDHTRAQREVLESTFLFLSVAAMGLYDSNEDKKLE